MNDTRFDAVGTGTVFDASVVRAFHDQLSAPVDDTDPVAELRALEELKNAVAARKARLAVAVHETQRARDVPRGISAGDTAREAGCRVALARRCAPHLGSRLLGLAHAVAEEMPHALAALSAGVISEWDVTGLCQETACLSREDRGAVDAAVADQLGTVSHRRLITVAQEHAYRLDPAAVAARRAHAETERRVSLRPAPDCMTRLSALLPVQDGSPVTRRCRRPPTRPPPVSIPAARSWPTPSSSASPDEPQPADQSPIRPVTSPIPPTAPPARRPSPLIRGPIPRQHRTPKPARRRRRGWSSIC